jgi:hypothetical protein
MRLASRRLAVLVIDSAKVQPPTRLVQGFHRGGYTSSVADRGQLAGPRHLRLARRRHSPFSPRDALVSVRAGALMVDNLRNRRV